MRRLTPGLEAMDWQRVVKTLTLLRQLAVHHAKLFSPQL
jgi:hypothetical protein